MSAYLRMINICKQFPGVLANDHVNFELFKGEVHALLGENGAGKSTLMNILSGLYPPTSGEIWLNGKEVHVNSPKTAIELGIGMVHQHFMLIPALSVVENIVLGIKQKREPFLDLKELAADIQNLAMQYGMKIDPFAKVWQISVGEQQRVEIIKALYRGAELLILDEPTAVLTPQETEELFKMIRSLTKKGHTVVFISHKLNEVKEISDRITVLRQGKNVGTVQNSSITKEELAKMMVGREIKLCSSKGTGVKKDVILELKEIEAQNNKHLKALKKISLEVRKGEILGIAGVDGNGQSELVEAITGLRTITHGKVLLNGKDVTNMSPRTILDSSVSHIPEDRHLMGLVMTGTLKENAILINYHKPPFSSGAFLNWKYITNYTCKLIKEYDVRTPSEDVLAKNLSGGNQQKLILARELDRNPDLLIAMHPTRGLDVGAIEYIYNKITEQRDKGSAVLLVSTELDEILTLSDRIAVIYEGQIMGIIDCQFADIEHLGLMMAGTPIDQIKKQVS